MLTRLDTQNLPLGALLFPPFRHQKVKQMPLPACLQISTIEYLIDGKNERRYDSSGETNQGIEVQSTKSYQSNFSSLSIY